MTPERNADCLALFRELFQFSTDKWESGNGMPGTRFIQTCEYMGRITISLYTPVGAIIW